MKIITNAFWLSLCRISTDILSFVLFAVISRTFGPSGTGEYSYAFAIATLVALTSTAGFEDYGIRQYARADDHDRAQLWQDIFSTQCVQLVLGLSALILLLLAGVLHASSWIVILELSIYVTGWSLSRTFYVPAMASGGDYRCTPAGGLCGPAPALAAGRISRCRSAASGSLAS
jgi:O-antigen/teichoic acid export membrane protein